MHASDLLIHGANVLYLFSYLVRDILWLRALTVVAIVTLMIYFVLEGSWIAFGWNVVFLGINLVQIVRLLLERRPIDLEPREERLYHLAFRALTPREFRGLATVGAWSTSPGGTSLVAEGTALDELRVICEGEAAVKVSGATVATLGDGHFVGEMSYLTGDPTCASVETVSETLSLHWDRATLDRWLEANPSVRASLQQIVGTDLVGKLRRGTG